MVDGEELQLEAAQRDVAGALDLVQLGLLGELVLRELALDEAQGELGAIDADGHVEVLEEEGQRARVVLVAVGDDDAAELGCVLEQVGVVRQDEVDAHVLVVWEHQAGVDEHDVVAALEGGHVLADGVEAAQRDHAHLGGVRLGTAAALRAAAGAADRGGLLPTLLLAGCLALGRCRCLLLGGVAIGFGHYWKCSLLPAIMDRLVCLTDVSN